MRSADPSTDEADGCESERLRVLAVYGVLDTPPEAHFDELARLATRLCDTPIAVITLVDDHRQWFKAEIGLNVRETPRSIAFCAHTIQGPGLFQVPDARCDARFANNSLVTGEPRVRFYAGVPLQVESGHRLGSLAVLDRRPRRLTPAQQSDLESLARQVVLVLEERRLRLLAERASNEAQRQSDSLLAIAGRVARLGAWELDIAQQKVMWSDVVADIHDMPRGFSPDLDKALAFYVEPGRSLLTESVAACLERGTPFDHELVLQPAGSGQPRWVRAIGEAVRGADGHITHLRGACQDITERKSHVLQIQHLAERFSATFESIPDPFLAVGADARVQLANAAFERLVQRERAGILGRTLPEVLPPTVIQAPFLDRCSQAMRSQQPLEFDATEVRSGHRFEVRLFPVDNGLTIHARDITLRESTLAQLRQAQKMESIGTLAGGIAHDFNNILGAILGNVELVRDALPPTGAGPVALAIISSSAQRARSLVQQILAFGRQQATQRLKQPLHPLIEESARLLRATLPANVTLTATRLDVEVCAEVDGNQLQQVLINLCTNAWHAMAAGGGRIEIGLDTEGPASPACAHLWIKDDGCGMPPEVQGRIFEPFFTTKPVGQGTGLGLSAAHGIVQAHGGHMEVDSELGRGSTFHIYLPVCAPADPAASAKTAAIERFQLTGLKVLCVDDDPVMLTTMQALLEREGCVVDAQFDPQMAIERLRTTRGDTNILVTDFNMPEMDGLALVQAAKRINPDLPVVMASGFLSDKLCEQAALLGVTVLVQKERTVEDLVAAVCEAIARVTFRELSR